MTQSAILTPELTDYERDILLPRLLAGLMKRWGEDKAITSTDIIVGFFSKGISIDGIRIRKMVEYTRQVSCTPHDPLPNACICSGPKGYWLSSNPTEIQRNMDKNLVTRRDSIDHTISCIKKKVNHLYSRAQSSIQFNESTS